jgi:hypothetical protein
MQREQLELTAESDGTGFGEDGVGRLALPSKRLSASMPTISFLAMSTMGCTTSV